MTNIVERLRDLETRHKGFYLGEAADALEALQARAERLARAAAERIDWQERAEKAEAEIERLRTLKEKS